jgi:hypothetical protein
MRTPRRAAVAALIALCGIAISVGSIQPWMTARGPRPDSGIQHTAVAGVLHWRYQSTSTFSSSFGMVVIIAGALVFIGGLLASQEFATLFSSIALLAAGLWIGLNATQYGLADLRYTDLQVGAWLVVAGSVVSLMSSFFVRRREA